MRPRVVILPFPVGRHPDHRIASELGRDACFLAGLARYEAAGRAPPAAQDPVRPRLPGGPGQADVRGGHQRSVRAEDGRRSAATRASSTAPRAAGEIFPTGQDLYALVETQNAHYGSLIRTRYGEPFFTEETVRVDDVVALESEHVTAPIGRPLAVCPELPEGAGRTATTLTAASAATIFAAMAAPSVYLDHAATTPVRPEVLEAMLPYLGGDASATPPARTASAGPPAGLEQARREVAEALGAEPTQVVFTSGGTEADNLAILGPRAGRAGSPGGRMLAAVAATEHKAVLAAAHAVDHLGGPGADPPGRPGRVGSTWPRWTAALAEHPAVVSVMWVNNETGVVQPIAEIAGACQAAGVAVPHRPGAGVRQAAAVAPQELAHPARDPLRPQDRRAQGRSAR